MSAFPARRARRGFTFVELFVAIGVVALLVALVVPTVGLARERGQRTRCMANLRDLGAATFLYANDNAGYFPAPAERGSPRPDDWIYWDAARVPDHDRGALVRYLGSGEFNPDQYRCPADPLDDHIAYPYSYTMNRLMTGSRDAPRRLRVSDVRRVDRKLLIVEENPKLIDDGAWSADLPTYDHRSPLSARHDDPDAQDSGGGMGNALYTDGHVEFGLRAWAEDPRSWDPAK
jgi:prepilin-type processing-associated H-X9-DG protein